MLIECRFGFSEPSLVPCWIFTTRLEHSVVDDEEVFVGRSRVAVIGLVVELVGLTVVVVDGVLVVDLFVSSLLIMFQVLFLYMGF